MKTAQKHTTTVRTVHHWTTALYTDNNMLFAAIYGALTPDVPDGAVDLIIHNQAHYDANKDGVDEAYAELQATVSEAAEDYQGLVTTTTGSVDIEEE